MQVIRDVSTLQQAIAGARAAHGRVALVPTMGALHEGHLSLLDTAGGHAAFRVMSIYVNPTQFGPAEDRAQYPRPFEQDCELARQRGCDVVFAPGDADMYPAGFSTTVTVGVMGERLCGASRLGHFAGVATVVLKLFNLVQPDVAVFGRKDAQQLLAIRRMARDLNVAVTVIGAPTVREADGLAMSSRNTYLTPAERAQAPALYEGLAALEKSHAHGQRDAGQLRDTALRLIGRATLFTLEYLEIVDTETLQPLQTIDRTALVALAARSAQSRTRLIDNVVPGGDL